MACDCSQLGHRMAVSLERAVVGGNLQASGGRQQARTEEKKGHATVLFMRKCMCKAREGNTNTTTGWMESDVGYPRMESGGGWMKSY